MSTCPVCDGPLRSLDLPNYNLARCDTCNELVQQVHDNTLIPLGSLLERNALGDDRVRAAISSPHVANVRSFIDVFENAERVYGLTMAEAKGGLRDALTQLVNRLDIALSELSGLDLASDQVGRALAAVREARELASPMAPRKRGIRGGD